jgi:glycine/D-amino acid oxidase-like deaminating enzyme
MTGKDYRDESLWLETVPGDLEPRARLERDEQVDVAIVGAGYTGLWTAYYLRALQPDVRVALVESEIAGFGASGRNGGWCLGTIPGIDAYLARPAHRERGLALQRALFAAVDEVGRVCEAEGIECHFAKGGTLQIATVAPHRAELRAQIEFVRSVGFGEEDYRWLEPEECAERVRARRNLGGLYFPHCAAVHPARLARGLADAVERRGVAIYERSPALAVGERSVVTPGGRLRADVVLLATEGYTPTIPGRERSLVPIHSMMVATEPLAGRVWEEIGLRGRETFGDPRRMVVYGQRTGDDRVAFGGRAGYYLGSGIRNRFPQDHPGFEQVRRTLVSFFPVLADARITHRWGGPLGVPRTWQVGVGLDRSAGLAWGGGYVGEGVCASNLVARTLADLILERDTECARLPWVRKPSRDWEREPLRWLAITGIRRLGESLDRAELSTGRSPRVRRALFRALVRR